jgi:fucose permease
MEQGVARPAGERSRIAVAFVAITLIGVAAGATGVLLPGQMAQYGVDKATIGLIFIAFSVGYMISAGANGPLMHRLGVRAHLMLGTAIVLASAVALVLPGRFASLLLLQVTTGLGMGMLDAGLNTYLSTLARPAALLNYFHAFFGLGALLGPLIAAGLLKSGRTWHAFFAIYAVVALAQLVAVRSYPRGVRAADEPGERPSLTSALRLPAVLLMAAFLGVYVSVEGAVGSWSFSFLTEGRGQDVLAAGWVVSGYWFGLMMGRLTLNTIAERLGVGVVGLGGACVGAVTVALLIVWAVPSALGAAAGFVIVGYFLGPLFPVTIATAPRLVAGPLVSTAIGIMMATSIAGGAALPWLVGTAAQRVGVWALLPLAAATSAILGVIGWRIALRLRAEVRV